MQVSSVTAELTFTLKTVVVFSQILRENIFPFALYSFSAPHLFLLIWCILSGLRDHCGAMALLGLHSLPGLWVTASRTCLSQPKWYLCHLLEEKVIFFSFLPYLTQYSLYRRSQDLSIKSILSLISHGNMGASLTLWYHIFLTLREAFYSRFYCLSLEFSSLLTLE